MKKKVTQKIIMIVIVVILVLLGIIYYSENINKISLIENIKLTINKQNENTQNNNITTIDVTNLVTGEGKGHNCELYFIKKYDEQNHWNECKLCNEKYNIESHTYIDNGWTMGTSCSENNVHKFSCSCGYNITSTQGRKSHDIIFGYDTGPCVLNSYCKVCRGNWKNEHECIKNDGSKINCSNLGTCKICGYSYTTRIVYHTQYMEKLSIGGEISCIYCNKKIGTLNYKNFEKISNTQYRISLNITVLNGCNFTSIENHHNFGQDITINTEKMITNGNTWECVQTLNINNYRERGADIRLNLVGNDGIQIVFSFCNEIDKIDEETPTISNIECDSEEWSRTKPIIISGTENYCRSVTVKILDENNEIIYEGKGTVENNKYSVTCIPEIEANEIGKKYKVIVTDSCENTTEQEITIKKVDSISPEITSEDSVSNEWAKEKKFTFTAKDYGIGNVKIAFNEESDYGISIRNGEEYSREYKFIGDVYQPKQALVYYKDELENLSLKLITLDKLDNTAPTITDVSLHNNKLNITSHDEHETLGEGSGVIKYKYIASEEKLSNPEFNSSNTIEVNKDEEIKVKDIYKIKYIYIVAEDLVGNVSEVYELKVPELILTSSVNLNTADGKGEIILDWSSYDISDKYFVVYRKKENQVDWEEIVPLTQKLTGSIYIDKLGNDEAKPEIPNITITGDTTNNNINITANSKDTGTNYKYYIESYDNIGTLIRKSN